jgi:hypothetical protein
MVPSPVRRLGHPTFRQTRVHRVLRVALLAAACTPATGGRIPSSMAQISAAGVRGGAQNKSGIAVIATVRNLDAYPRHRVHALEVGDAMGFHGEIRCEGALLSDILAASRAPSGADVEYVIAATDGFRPCCQAQNYFPRLRHRQS